MNYSTFPEQVDTFVRKYHLQAQDIPKMKEWKTLKEKINRTPEEETRLSQLTEDLRYAFIDPEEWNKFQDALVNTQQFFLDEVYVYIQQKQAEFDAELEKFNHKGEYNPARQYYKRNTVTFQGETYLCLKDCIGIAPDPFQDTEYWAKIAQRGEKGDPGVGLKFRGQYNPNIYYQVDDAVQYGGSVFACLKENIGIEPNLHQDTEYWALAIARGDDGIPRGAIIMWSGGIDDIPTGWALCDGTNGTPDLRDRFIVGAGGEYAVGDTGGAKEVSLTTAQLPSHSHGSGTLSTSSAGSHSHGSGTLTTNTTGEHRHDNYAKIVHIVEGGLPTSVFGPTRSSALATASAGSHSHTISGSTASAGSHSHSISGSTSSVGSGQAHENRPPYFALAYIMKL